MRQAMTAAKNHGIEVRGIKTFKGIEGQGYNAGLYLNGKKIAGLIDKGNGGAVYIHYLGNGDERKANAKKVGKAIADAGSWKSEYEPTKEYPYDEATFVGELVSIAIDERDWRRRCGKTVYFRTLEDKAKNPSMFRTYKGPYTVAVRVRIIEKYGKAVEIMNDLYGKMIG